jgi:hypothetical protein
VTLRKSLGYALAAWLLTQLYFVLSLIPFRAASFAEAAGFARRLVAGAGTQTLHLAAVPLVNLVFCAGFIVLIHLLELPMLKRVRGTFFALPAPLRGLAYGLVTVYLFLFVPVGASTFIYRQF